MCGIILYTCTCQTWGNSNSSEDYIFQGTCVIVIDNNRQSNNSISNSNINVQSQCWGNSNTVIVTVIDFK